jgi:spectinomycin phosphotransferase
MLEKPDVQDDAIIRGMQTLYELPVSRVVFLPLGADPGTAVYRVVTGDGTAYFLKLRRGAFDTTSVDLPRCLSDQGLAQIIAPLPTRTGRLWGTLDACRTTILYPFVQGRDGYEMDLSDDHWREVGAALKRLHTARLPSELLSRIPMETYSSRWRGVVRACLARVRTDAWAEPVAAEAAAFLRARHEETLDLVDRTERLAQSLLAGPPEEVVCHSDLHAGNVLIDGSGTLYIVDWDAPIRAPKERDLMYPGGGQFANRRSPQDEETLFYQGYGPAQVDPVALAYYRYERIVEDIAVFSQQLLGSDEGGQDREQALGWLKSNYLPGNTIEIARSADRATEADAPPSA